MRGYLPPSPDVQRLLAARVPTPDLRNRLGSSSSLFRDLCNHPENIQRQKARQCIVIYISVSQHDESE